jgi:hypothetical protein
VRSAPSFEPDPLERVSGQVRPGNGRKTNNKIKCLDPWFDCYSANRRFPGREFPGGSLSVARMGTGAHRASEDPPPGLKLPCEPLKNVFYVAVLKGSQLAYEPPDIGREF